MTLQFIFYIGTMFYYRYMFTHLSAYLFIQVWVLAYITAYGIVTYSILVSRHVSQRGLNESALTLQLINIIQETMHSTQKEVTQLIHELFTDFIIFFSKKKQTRLQMLHVRYQVLLTLPWVPDLFFLCANFERPSCASETVVTRFRGFS